MKFEVDEKMVEPIIRDHISAAVVAALGDPEKIIHRAVSLALSQKVDDRGEVNKYSSYNKYDFIEVLSGNAIREAARDAIQTIVNEQKPQIQKTVEDHLKRSPKKTAASIVAAFCETGGKDYRLNADFTFSSNSSKG